MLFSNVVFSSMESNELMRMYHTMRSSDFFFPERKNNNSLPESRLDLTKGAIVSEPGTCRQCEVFNKYLVYAFYGRPAFKFDPSKEPGEPYPVFLVFSPDTQQHPAAIYPFDTGAFKHGIYGNAYTSDNLEDYALANNAQGVRIADVAKLIKLIWGNNKNYYNGDVPQNRMKTNRNVQLTDLDQNYLSVIYNKRYGKADSRAFTIEFIYEKCLPLESLQVIYLPNAISDEETLKVFDKIQAACGREVWVERLPAKYNENNDQLDVPFTAMLKKEAEQFE